MTRTYILTFGYAEHGPPRAGPQKLYTVVPPIDQPHRRYSTERGIVYSVPLTRHYSVLFLRPNNKYALVNNVQLLAW